MAITPNSAQHFCARASIPARSGKETGIDGTNIRLWQLHIERAVRTRSPNSVNESQKSELTIRVYKAGT